MEQSPCVPDSVRSRLLDATKFRSVKVSLTSSRPFYNQALMINISLRSAARLTSEYVAHTTCATSITRWPRSKSL